MQRSNSSDGTTSIQPLAFDVGHRLAAIDQRALGCYRLKQRVRTELQRPDYAAAVLSDPINIDYVTGTRDIPIWTLHAPGRYASVAANGPVVLFEFSTCRHLVRGLETVDEVRTGVSRLARRLALVHGVGLAYTGRTRCSIYI
jgi:hypothetical protein